MVISYQQIFSMASKFRIFFRYAQKFRNNKIVAPKFLPTQNKITPQHPLSVFAVAVLALSTLTNTVFAQEFSGNSRFIRQLDAVSWSLGSGFDLTTSNTSISIENSLNSRMFLFNGRAQNIQDEHSASLRFQTLLAPRFGATGSARTYTFTTTNLRQDLLLAGFFYRPVEQITLTATTGVMRDERSDRKDQGLAINISAITRPFQIGETTIQPSASADVAWINPRRLQTLRAGASGEYRQGDQFILQSDFWVGNSRRDSYQASSLLNRTETDFIESIENDSALVSLQIQTPLSGSLIGNISFDALNNVRKNINSSLDSQTSTILYDSRSLRQFLDITTSVLYPGNRFSLQAGTRWGFQVRESQLINTEGLPSDQVRRRSEILENSNFNQSRFEIFTANQLRINERYNVLINGNASILRYDTPEINRDDRDELSFLLRNVHTITIRNDLRATITLAGEAFHYVYLFSERSIENNWRRSVRLIPELRWQPNPLFTMTNRFMVRANYTVEDYELAGRPKNDQSARELAMSSNISWTFAPDWNLQTETSRSELRIGRLFWETFQETPTDTLITWDTQVVVSKRIGNIVVSSGMRYFRKFDFLQRASIQIEVEENGSVTRLSRISTGNQVTVQWGPVVTIRMPLNMRNELYINGWYQMQQTRQRLYITYPEAYRTDFLRAERNAIRRVFPNIEMTVRFRF
jgi:hypothetical protein